MLLRQLLILLYKVNMKSISVFTFFIFLGFQGISQPYISKEKAKADLEFYNKTLEEIHYNPFLFVAKDVYLAEVEKIKNSLQDSVRVQDFIISLQGLSALMEDSHSGPALQQPVLLDAENKKQFFPYKTVMENDKLFVPKEMALVSDIPAGSEITAINNIPLRPLLVQYQKNIGGLPQYKKEIANRLLFRSLYLSGIKAPFLIDYIEPSGRKDQKQVEEGISNVQGLLMALPGYSEGNYYKVLEGKTGYIKFSNMNGSVDEWIQFLKTAFTEFREKNVQQVAIDIRDNSGGNSLFGEVLFGFLSPKEYQLMGYKKWKVSEQYKNYLLENGNIDHEYLQKETGSIWELGECQPTVSRMPVDDKFMGQVYLLTGAFTFSSGNMVADGAKEFKLATLVGEPTGEMVNDFGEVFSIILPNTGLIINLTTSMDIGAGCNPDLKSAVIPDIIVVPSLDDRIKGKDKVLEYVLKQGTRLE